MRNISQDCYSTLIQLLSGMVEAFLTSAALSKPSAPSSDTLAYLQRVILEEDYIWADHQLTAEILGTHHFVLVARGEAA